MNQFPDFQLGSLKIDLYIKENIDDTVPHRLLTPFDGVIFLEYVNQQTLLPRISQ